MGADRHLLVIGGGVIGLTTAFHAARRGLRVTLIERHGPDRDGCSFGNAGMICPSHFVPLAAPGMVALGLRWMWNPASPFYIKPRLDWDLWAWGLRFCRACTLTHVTRSAPLLRDLSMASRAGFEEIADLPGADFGLEKRGLLMLCRTAEALHEETGLASRAADLGIPAEVLDARQVATLEPGVRMSIAGGVYFPRDCHLVPDRFLAVLEDHARQAGARFAWNTGLRHWRVRGDRITGIETTQGDLQADEYVLCGGSWSPLAVRDLGLKLPMQAGKGYSLTLPNPRQLPKICAIFTEARVAVTPMNGALRFGGTMELSGLDETVQPARVRGIIEAVPRYFPEFTPADFEGIPAWRGLRPVTPDGLPYLGRTLRWSNLIIATGHAMLGLSLAPITGRIVTQLACNERPDIAIDLLSPDRFG